jgi:hypothetical protein
MEFIFKVSEEEANLIMAALMEMPYKVSAGIIQKINQQAYEQRQKATTEPHDEV